MKKYLPVILLMFFTAANAQPFVKGIYGENNGRAFNLYTNGLQTALTGYILDTMPPNNTSAYLVSLDNNGNTKWAKKYGQLSEMIAKPTPDKGYLCGANLRFESDSVVVFKTDSNGNVIWASLFSTGTGTGYFRGILPAANGDVLVLGQSTAPPIVGVYVARFNSTGNLLWCRMYMDSTDMNNYKPANDIIEFPNGNLMVACSDSGLMLLRTKPDGSYIDGHYFETGFVDIIRMKAIDDNSYGVAASYQNPSLANEYCFWTNLDTSYGTYGQHTYSYDSNYIQTMNIGMTEEGDAVFCGRSYDLSSSVFWFKTGTKISSANNHIIYTRRATINSNAYAVQAVTELPDRRLLLAGDLAKLTWDLSDGGPDIIRSGPAPDILLMSTDTEGRACDSMPLLINLGNPKWNHHGIVFRDSLVGSAVATTVTPFDSYAEQILCGDTSTPTAINFTKDETDFHLFPNPTTGKLWVQWGKLQQTDLKIFDITGKLILNNKVSLQNTAIDVGILQSGVYLLEISSADKRTVRKFIKE